MPKQRDLPKQPGAVQFKLLDLVEHLRNVDVLVLAYFDPMRNAMQVVPIGDERAIRPDTMVYQVPGQYEVAAYMAAKQMLNEGNDDGAIAALASVADETLQDRARSAFRH
jgi:hypothetical protein